MGVGWRRVGCLECVVVRMDVKVREFMVVCVCVCDVDRRETGREVWANA